MVDKWKELSPAREEMIRTLLEHDGISEHAAALSFGRGDLSWAKRNKLVDVRPYRDRSEIYATDAGRALIR